VHCTPSYSISAPLPVDDLGNVYVADKDNHRIKKYTSNGALDQIFGSSGTDVGKFNQPIGIDVDSSGSIYVTELHNHRVQKYNVETETWTILTGGYGIENGEFKEPTDIAVCENGDFYVTDHDNHRVQKFNSDGVFIGRWGVQGSEDGCEPLRLQPFCF